MFNNNRDDFAPAERADPPRAPRRGGRAGGGRHRAAADRADLVLTRRRYSRAPCASSPSSTRTPTRAAAGCSSGSRSSGATRLDRWFTAERCADAGRSRRLGRDHGLRRRDAPRPGRGARLARRRDRVHRAGDDGRVPCSGSASAHSSSPVQRGRGRAGRARRGRLARGRAERRGRGRSGARRAAAALHGLPVALLHLRAARRAPSSSRRARRRVRRTGSATGRGASSSTPRSSGTCSTTGSTRARRASQAGRGDDRRDGPPPRDVERARARAARRIPRRRRGSDASAPTRRSAGAGSRDHSCHEPT